MNTKPRERIHKIRVDGKDYTHRGDKKDCIICSGKAAGVIGEKTGGHW